jgi:hypothetical protein
VELTNVLQAIQKGLILERDRTASSQLDSSLLASEPDLVASEVMAFLVLVYKLVNINI